MIDSEEKRKEALEHRDVVLAIKAILESPHGRKFFEYLFDKLDVGELPGLGLEGNILHDDLGRLRAGNSIYKIVCEANWERAASILAKVEKQRYDTKIQEALLERENRGV